MYSLKDSPSVFYACDVGQVIPVVPAGVSSSDTSCSVCGVHTIRMVTTVIKCDGDFNIYYKKNGKVRVLKEDILSARGNREYTTSVEYEVDVTIPVTQLTPPYNVTRYRKRLLTAEEAYGVLSIVKRQGSCGPLSVAAPVLYVVDHEAGDRTLHATNVVDMSCVTNLKLMSQWRSALLPNEVSEIDPLLYKVFVDGGLAAGKCCGAYLGMLVTEQENPRRAYFPSRMFYEPTV